MLTFKDDDLHAKLRKDTGAAAVAPARDAFSDLEADVGATRRRALPRLSHLGMNF